MKYLFKKILFFLFSVLNRCLNFLFKLKKTFLFLQVVKYGTKVHIP